MTPAERLELWQDPGGMWRWAYVRDDSSDDPPFELPANEPAVTREEALAEASLAYPGIPVTDPPEGRHPAPDEQPVDLRSRRWPWALATVALTGGLAALALRQRRWGIVLIAPAVAAGVVARLRRETP